MAALVLWSGTALEARASRASAASPQIVAVHEPSTLDSAAPPSASPLPVVVDVPRLGAPPSPPIAARNAATSTDETLAREAVWIAAARRDLRESAYGRALTALETHEQQFPRGRLAAEREWLKTQARSGLRHDRRQGSQR